jgi:DNA-binding MurR/RpiR family transcriptional regulator
MTLPDEQSFRDLVIARTAQLPPQQQKLAEFLLNHFDEIPFLSVPVLSQQAKVSEATVVRLAQTLGFRGFSALKAALMQVFRLKQPAMEGVLDSRSVFSGHDTLAAAGIQAVRNIQSTLKQVDQAHFSKIAATLFKADHIYCFGMGVSCYLAELFSYHMVQIGLRSTPLNLHTTSPLEQLVPLRVTDLLVAFSFSPYSTPTLDLVASAAKKGIHTLAFCDKLTAPIAKLAHHVVALKTDNMMFTNSLASTMVVINALATEVAVRYGDAREAVATINEILEQANDWVIAGEGLPERD